MKIYKKVFIIVALSLLILTFFNVQSSQAAISKEQLETLQAQINIIAQKIKELQALLATLLQNLQKTAVQSKQEQEIQMGVKSIILTSPNGKEAWETGKTYNIQWNSSGYTSDSKIKITLIDERKEPNSLDYEIEISQVDNNGLYSWAIPDLLEGREVFGSLYKIGVSAGQGNDKKSDNSDSYFTVKKPLSPYLNVISPNGGETWETGKTYKIKWDSPGFENQQVDIILKREAITQMRVADDIANLSYYNWTIPDNVSGNNTYRILIELHDTQGTPAASDRSNKNFTITRILR